MKLQYAGKTLDLTHRAAVVGVLNVTPDSYYAPSRTDLSEIARRALDLVRDGADIIEIGGESTGPGSKDVGVTQECERVLPAIEAVREALPDSWISVDTYKASVAERALQSGADIINDVTAGRTDEKMFGVVAAAGCPYILMFSKDETPRTVVQDVLYDDVTEHLRSFFAERVVAAEAAGIERSSIIIDPGLGHFVSARSEYSFQILSHLAKLCSVAPVMVSPSRKSFLAGKENLPPQERLPATLAATGVALASGARLIRTHDVRETRRICDAFFSYLS